jgi:predicted amidohydrolase
MIQTTLNVIVAACQFEPKFLDVYANIATAQQLVFEAAGKGAKVVVLPELCMSGFVFHNIREAASCAQEYDGYQTQALIHLAEQFGCHIVFGYVESHNGKLYNSACVVGPAGIEANTQKHNLQGSDNLWATSGEGLAPVVITPAGRLGVLICRDVSNKFRESYAFYKPEQRFYKKGSIDTIALLTNWGTHYNYPDSSWVELAEETNSNVIVSNRIGTERDIKFKGGSTIIDRNKNVWSHGSSFTEKVVVGGVVIL